MPRGKLLASTPGAQGPEWGVGLTHSPGLEPLLLEQPGLAEIIEVEPQTMWLERTDLPERYLAPAEALERLQALPGRKLVHGVGLPVGGSVPVDEPQFPLLRRFCEALEPPYFSEHLSFNRTPEFHAGFFLPPRQTIEGIRIAAANVRRLRTELGLPIAVETGVNYLRRRSDEMPDGQFVAEVASAADCGILLDVHNLYCNQRNGRQTVDEFLEQLPLERVWELHIAGGFEMDGYWLDAHSGAIPADLVEQTRQLLPRLPNLQAVVFEMFPSFLPSVGLEVVAEQLRILKSLKGLDPATIQTTRRNAGSLPASTGVSAQEWEATLGALAIESHAPASPLREELEADPGLDILRRLIAEFRASMLVSSLRLTSRLLMLALGPEIFRAILQDYWSKRSPSPFAATEALAFVDYLDGIELAVPRLHEIAAYERAAIRTLLDGEARVVRFAVDPLPMLRALAEGRLSDIPGDPGEYEIEITPDTATVLQQ